MMEAIEAALALWVAGGLSQWWLRIQQ